MRKGRRRVVARNSRTKANMAKHEVITFAPIISLATLVAVPLLSNGMLMMWKIQQAKQDDAKFIRSFHPDFIPVTGLKCSYCKISRPFIEIPVRKTEISGTEPARPLIWNYRKFYKGFGGKARSRKPGQLGQPGSCEDGLTHNNTFKKRRTNRLIFLPTILIKKVSLRGLDMFPLLIIETAINGSPELETWNSKPSFLATRSLLPWIRKGSDLSSSSW